MFSLPCKSLMLLHSGNSREHTQSSCTDSGCSWDLFESLIPWSQLSPLCWHHTQLLGSTNYWLIVSFCQCPRAWIKTHELKLIGLKLNPILPGFLCRGSFWGYLESSKVFFWLQEGSFFFFFRRDHLSCLFTLLFLVN